MVWRREDMQMRLTHVAALLATAGFVAGVTSAQTPPEPTSPPPERTGPQAAQPSPPPGAPPSSSSYGLPLEGATPPGPPGHAPPLHGGYHGPWVAPSLPPHADPCRRSTSCAERGACTLLAGQCVVFDDASCHASRICRERGACSAVDGVCRPQSDDDCQLATICTERQLCFYDRDDDRCDDGTQRRSRAALIAGITTIAAGGAAVIAGAFLASSPSGRDDAPGTRWGVGLLVAGGVTMAGSIPLIVHGAGKVKRTEVSLGVGPAHLDLTWRF